MNLTSTSLRKVSATLRDAVLAALYPATCHVCGAMIESWRDGVACNDCWREGEEKIGQIRAQNDFCLKCGMPLFALPTLVFTAERSCGRCDELAFGFARACGIYEGALRESVLWMKFHPRMPPRLRPQLQMVFADLNTKQPLESILPVPLHADRLAARTFNQSEIIARELAALTGLRVDAASLVRTRHTEKHRAGMAARERARSLEKAFQVRAPRLIAGKSLLLVDDVMTTGSTAHAITEVLLAGGARAVSVLTLARAASEFV